jgi:hypothetical protein
MWWLKGLNVMAGNLYYLLDSRHCHPTSLIMLSATEVGFFRDFLLPTIIGCLPMILQNVSIVCHAGAAVASTTGSQKSHIYSYLFPTIGIVSSILISWRIKQYSSSALAIPEELKSAPINGNANGDNKLVSDPSENIDSGKTKRR